MRARPTSGVFANGMSYQRWGSGPKTLLFAPGGPGNTLPTGLLGLMSGWMVRPYVAAGYTVWMVTRRRNLPVGHGIADMADDYAHLIADRFGGRIDIYLGISYGAAIGFHLAARHPEAVDHVALVGFGAEASPAALDEDLGYASKVAQGRIAEVGRDMARDMLPRRGFGWLAHLIGPALGRAAVGEPHEFLTHDIAIEAEAERSYSAWEILRSITVPVLLVAGDHDLGAPTATIEETARLIPTCTLEIYEGRTHEQVIMDRRLPRDVLAFVDRTQVVAI